MNRNKHILTLTSVVLVFFLFTPIVIRTIEGSFNGQLKKIAVSKAAESPAKADSQMPFEEKEKEECVDNTITHFTLICILSEFIPFTSTQRAVYPNVLISGFHGSTPIYLAKRSILI